VSILIGVPAALVLFVNVNFSNMNGRGRVVDYKTHESIPGVELTANCARGNLVHGTRTIRTIRSRSGPDGEYQFSFFDTWHCSLFFLFAKKAGYVRLIDAGIPDLGVGGDFGSVPATTWMVKDEDVVPRRVE
jgi:hypothetical protein